MSFADAEHEAFATTLAGIDVPEKLYESLRHETTLAATRLYHRLAEKIAVESMTLLNKKEKQKEKEARALEEAANLPVEEVVRRSFMNAMKKRDGKKFECDKYPNIVDFMSMLRIEVKEPVLRSNASTSNSGVPKNEVSPGGGQGSTKTGASRLRESGVKSSSKGGTEVTGLVSEGWKQRKVEKQRLWQEGQRQRRKSLSFEKMVDCHRQRLSRDLKARDLAWLCKHDILLSNVYVIRQECAAWIADHPGKDEIPWPALLTLGSHSRKHIFAENAVFGPSVLCSLRSFVSKVKWRWVFREAKELPPRALLKK